MITTRVMEWVFKGVVICALIVMIALHYLRQDAIVYVDAVKLINNYKGMQEARQQFDANTSTWRMNLDTLRMEFEAEIKKYHAGKNKMTTREKELTEKLLEAKRSEYLNYESAINDKIQSEDRNLSSKITNDINGFLKKYGQAHGYEIIFAATQYGNIVYAHEGKDITDEVLLELNR